jgi:hypothetical protein
LTNNELEGKWKKTIMTKFKELSRNFPGGTEENGKKNLSQITLTFLREVKYVFLEVNTEYLRVSSISKLPYKQEGKATPCFPSEKIRKKVTCTKLNTSFGSEGYKQKEANTFLLRNNKF